MKCPLEDCNKDVFEELDIVHWVIFTCKGLHDVVVAKFGIKTETKLRCYEAMKEGFHICKGCGYEWCKYNSKYNELKPEKVNCPVCGTIWDDDEEYCKKCIEESEKNA